ncbi:uncharacterized protein LOC124348962 isoform X1 [Daphnia pulicaria]|uniref:uncharacterized protein LOC124348962 isoform X1 n=1 Tax=Daphnia pulicaria TaxID=35523 RepID=UPI001EEA9E79|nr:uncharacterized protein LOC124348962 isoform X1 [Daphnia pulicaria]
MYNNNKSPPNGYHRNNPGANGLISLSVMNIFLWLLCTTFSAMILIRFNSPNSLIRFASLDLISPGVWGSLFYGLGGLLGICAAYERSQPLLVATLVLAMLSIFSSLGIAAVSGAMAISPRFRSYHNSTWLGLEWTLLILSILGFIVNFSVFVSVSVLICRPCCPNNRRNNCQSQTRLLPAPPPPANCNNNNNLPNNNYMGADMANMPPPPPGFIINPPVVAAAVPQQQQQMSHQQQINYSNTSTPLPRVLVTSDTNF